MKRPSTWWNPGPAVCAAAVLVANTGYAGLVIGALRSSKGAVGPAMAAWNQLVRPFVSRVLAAVGAPDCGWPGGFLQPYESLVVVEATGSLVLLVLSAWRWRAWARQLQSAPRWRSMTPEQRDDRMAMRQGLALLGAGFLAWVLLGGDPLFQATACAHPSVVLCLRVPLLVSAIFGLSTLAAIFGVARR